MKALQAARAALATLALAAASAHAGGPLAICNSAAVKYPGAGTVSLNHDGGGTYGNRSKAQVDAIVTVAARDGEGGGRRHHGSGL